MQSALPADEQTQKLQLRILIADDHEMVLETFAIYLTSGSDMNVTMAKTLDEALQLIAQTACGCSLQYNPSCTNGHDFIQHTRRRIAR